MSKEYISKKDTAKLIRLVLKEAFPGIKFSVRGPRGGSIDIGWTDGPTDKQVKAYVDRFEGSYFDGMIDYKGAIFASLDGRPVHFMADFIFTRRDYSDAAKQRAIDIVYNDMGGNFEQDGFPKPTIEQLQKGELYNWQLSGVHHYGGQSVQNEIHDQLSKRSRIVGQDSPTARRVRVTGDDGYSKSHGAGYDHTPQPPKLEVVK